MRPASVSMRLNWRASASPAQVTARRHWPATMTTTSRDLSTERISTRGSAGHSRTGPSVRPKGHPRPLMERSGRASAPPANEAGKGGAKDKLKAVIIRIVAMHTRLPSWVNRVISGVTQALPLHPKKRTYPGPLIGFSLGVHYPDGRAIIYRPRIAPRWLH